MVNGKQVHSLVLAPLEEGRKGSVPLLWIQLVWHNSLAEQRLLRVH